MTSARGNLERTRPETAWPETAWQQLECRDPQARFFYAVITTGVFCRVSCASRRPLRKNVRFFASADAARAAGFRACLRCRPESDVGNAVAVVRQYIEQHSDRALSLKELGHIAGLSPFTVQKQFKQQMGVSPLAYQRALKARLLRSELRRGGNVTKAIYEAGYGSSSRVYSGTSLGMTPAKFAQGGRGEQIRYTAAKTPYGWLIVGATDRGLCWLALGATQAEAEDSLQEEFPQAVLKKDTSLKSLVEEAVSYVAGQSSGKNLTLDLRGTAFQLRVWHALREIPRGTTKTYSQLASDLGNPNATRAVARACATNRVSVVVPCHRIVGVSGSLTGYRWGVERKRALLEAEKIT